MYFATRKNGCGIITTCAIIYGNSGLFHRDDLPALITKHGYIGINLVFVKTVMVRVNILVITVIVTAFVNHNPRKKLNIVYFLFL